MGLRLTVDGRWYGLLVIGFTAAALNTGANLLLALSGGAVGVILANAWIARRGMRRLDVTLTGHAQSPQGSPLRVHVELGGPGCAVSFAVDAPWAQAPTGALGVEPGTCCSLQLTVDPPLPRGRHTLGQLSITSDAPFGLAQASVSPDSSHSVLVTPQVFRLRTGALDRAARGDGNAAASYLQGAEQRDRVRSLRDFRAGDSPRSIHWRSSARRGSLVVREFERGVPERSLVVVDVGPGDPAHVDAVLSLAASAHAALRARGERVGLAVLAERPLWLPPEATPTAVLEALALAQPRTSPGSDPTAALRSLGAPVDQRTWLITADPATRLPNGTRWLLSGPSDLDRWVRRGTPAPSSPATLPMGVA